jgi:probable HAF family extracellular repeat protein
LVVLGILGSNPSQALPASWGVAINDHEQVAGDSSVNVGQYHGFFYSGGIMQDIDALISTPGHPYNGPSSADGINNSGQIVGSIGTDEAYLYSEATYMISTLLYPPTLAGLCKLRPALMTPGRLLDRERIWARCWCRIC